jgi:repressor LexA
LVLFQIKRTGRMLTRKQYELLIFIDRHLKTHGVPPSFDEMKDALDLRSKSGIHRLITGLEERGFIRRLPHRARALEVLKLPENMRPGATPAAPRPTRFAPTVIEGRFANGGLAGVSEPRSDNGAAAVELPLYGRIAAGQPIEAMRDSTETFAAPAALLGSGEHYAVEVRGDSMIDAGIYDGDIAIIERCDNAENGTIVVALVDQNEVTLKRLRRKGASIALEPANPAHETRIFGPDRVTIQGRLKALYRRY